MRLGPVPQTDWLLLHEVQAELDARLMSNDPSPIAVAFSGGGDSLALLLAARQWADANGRRLLALTVDHRLQPRGAEWAVWCAECAARLGVAHRTLVWIGAKPVAGLSAAARLARHRLLADAARDAGAAVILLGHTADDLSEAALMRVAGSTTPDPRPWSPSPVWPQGRGLFLLRPMLGLRRMSLRLALAALGETWIEDPANADPGSARARARRSLSGAEPPPPACLPARPMTIGFQEGPAGDLDLPAAGLAPADLGAALLCAAGTDRPPRGESLGRLWARARSGEAFTATLAGARIDGDGRRLRIVRDIRDHRRTDLTPVRLPAGVAIVWDGRIELLARAPGAVVGPLAGRARRLPPELRNAILRLPAAVRPALPLITHADGALELPTLPGGGRTAAWSLSGSRLAAARGAIVNERAIRHMAKSFAAS
jgi:tRNA(Ile)-lysidine synthase